MENNSPVITAYISIFNPSGKSITTPHNISTAATIQSLAPDPKKVTKAITLLQQAGFDCNFQSTHIALNGPASLFEKYFKMKLSLAKHMDGFYAIAQTTPVIPDLLKDSISDLAFPEPVEAF